MKIVSASETVMVLRQGVWFSVILGIFFIIFGGVFVYMNAQTNGYSGPGLWLGAGAVLIGLLSAFFSRRTTVTLDKPGNKISVAKKGLWGRSAKEYVLANAAALQITERYITANTAGGGTAPERYENLALAFRNGSRVELDEERAGVIGGHLQILGNKMSAFLGIPLNRVVPGFQNAVTEVPPDIVS